MTSLTRGPLAAGVYWRRRLAVIGVALLLVLGLARLLGGGADPEPKATTVSSTTGGQPSDTPSPNAAPTSPSAAATVTVTPTPTTPVLPPPTGRCSDDDVVVAPSIVGAQATKTVVVKLTLRTRVTAACTWRASAHSLQLKITSGADRIWSTVDCPRAIPSEDVVVRRDTDATVDVAWSSRRSDEDCSQHTQWAMPGYYHASVAALGGEPQDIQFRLSKPLPDPTPTPTPKPTATAKPGAAKPGTPTAGPTAGPRDEPTAPPRKRHRRVD